LEDRINIETTPLHGTERHVNNLPVSSIIARGPSFLAMKRMSMSSDKDTSQKVTLRKKEKDYGSWCQKHQLD